MGLALPGPGSPSMLQARMGTGRATIVAGAWLAVLGCGDDGGAPRFVDPGPQVAVVAEPMLLSIMASDPDDDDLEYGFSSITLDQLRDDASITVAPGGQALFRWQPRAADQGQHLIDFTASDGRNEARISVPFDVRPSGEGTAPVFRKPLGEGLVHDLTSSPCVPDLEIEVYDPDDAQLEVTMLSPTVDDGALQMDDDGRTGRLSWCPTSEQRAAAGTYELTLQADDGDNPPTLERFTILLARGEDCPAQPPTLGHAVVDFEQLADLDLYIDASDDIGLVIEPRVAWATEPVPPEDAIQTASELVSGDLQIGTFRARLPNPAVPLGPGASTPLYYFIVALDEDGCITRSPAEGMHEIVVTNPGGPGAGPCEPCSWDAQCGGPLDLCLQLGVDTVACGRSCSGDAECGTGYQCSPQPATSVEGTQGRQCIPSAGVCADLACDDDHGC